MHTHMAKAGSIGRLAVLSSPRSHRPRLVHTFHGHVLQGYFGGAQQRGFLQMERFLARHTDALVAVSPEVRDELVDLGVGKPSQYLVIPLGLDLDRFLVVGSPGGVQVSCAGLSGSAPGRPWLVPSAGWYRSRTTPRCSRRWPPPLSFTWLYLATASSGRRWKAWPRPGHRGTYSFHRVVGGRPFGTGRPGCRRPFEPQRRDPCGPDRGSGGGPAGGRHGCRRRAPCRGGWRNGLVMPGGRP